MMVKMADYAVLIRPSQLLHSRTDWTTNEMNLQISKLDIVGHGLDGKRRFVIFAYHGSESRVSFDSLSEVGFLITPHGSDRARVVFVNKDPTIYDTWFFYKNEVTKVFKYKETARNSHLLGGIICEVFGLVFERGVQPPFDGIDVDYVLQHCQTRGDIEVYLLRKP